MSEKVATDKAGKAGKADNNAVIFRMENILIKNLSLEMPASIVTPTFKEDPTIKMELRNTSRKLNQDKYYEVVLEVTVRLMSGEEVQLLIELSQAGIVFMDNADNTQRENILNIHMPEMLYPYASQVISDLMSRAGVQRLFLPPFNFRALYEKKRQAVAEKLAAEKNESNPIIS